MVYGLMSILRFRKVTAINAAFLRRRSSATAAFSSSSISVTSSSKVSDDDDSKKSSHKRITLTLYRQLLRWCNDTDKEIPLSQLVPPIYLSPPQINRNSMNKLIGASEKIDSIDFEEDSDGPSSSSHSSIFSARTSVIQNSDITVHSVPTSEDAKQIIKAIFRMNAFTTDEHDEKVQMSLAFEWIKSLNELSQELDEMKEKRRKHQIREGVKFRIGQIVKHRTLAWRGVILGWSRRSSSNDEIDVIDSKNSSQATSLTQKPYKAMNPSYTDDDDTVVYDVALDWGDAALLMSSNKHPSGLKNVFQSDLTLVDDPDLMRIRSTTDQFQRFDPELLCFVPGDTLKYIYPDDRPTKCSSWESYKNPSDKSAENISQGIQCFAEYLRQIILGFTSAPEYRNLGLISGYLERLTNLSKGDVVPAEDRFRNNSLGESGYRQQNSAIIQTKMKWELQKLVELAVEIEDILWTRRTALETDRSIKFSLGDYVQHKKYGFRGVVVGWDPEPAYEVTHWDGLQHIDNPEQYPFYHIIPDRSDIMVAFGGERPWRYVCEENLEVCPMENRDLDIDLEPEWITDVKSGKYQPPEELLLRHGDELEDNGVTVKCLEELKNSINSIFYLIHKGKDDSVEHIDTDVDAILKRISMENMFHTLKHAENSDIATVLSDAFKEIWKGHKNKDVRYKFDLGVNYLLAGKTAKALSIFGEVVDEDPTYAEAWNKAATCEFMIGNLDASMAAAQKTLEIVPDHFQALNGLGLVYNEKRDLLHARDNFRKSMGLDPWSPVAPRLSVCLDTLKRWKDTSLLNSDERSDEPEWKNPYTNS